MLTNFHTHTTFSDGKNTPEEIVEEAIKQGIRVLGFSDHGYTPYDLRYCMKDEEGYVKEIRRLQEKYKKDIEIYLGVEEDSHALVDREKFDYIIGSCHYARRDGKHYPIDSNYDYFSACLSAFNNDEMVFAEYYFQHFCKYILSRKPDVIGHFDLITKFDETQKERCLSNPNYWSLAEKYCLEALKAGSIFELNTGLVTRGYRSSFCPHERLLHIIYKNGGKITISSDMHELKNLQGCFAEAKLMIKEIGFQYIYVFKNNEWKKDFI
jgi:histidinol-phosphatase (PHP family)